MLDAYNTWLTCGSLTSIYSRCECHAANMCAPAPRLDQFSPNQGMPLARPLGPPYASQVRLQSSDSIQIQMEPLQSMDSHAGRLMSPGMQVAIYSGRCPLLNLAAYQPPRATQQQACSCPSPSYNPPPPPTHTSTLKLLAHSVLRPAHELCTAVHPHDNSRHVLRSVSAYSMCLAAM